MRKKMQKYTAAMMAAIMALSAAPLSASAVVERNIVVIGDSISAGASLAEGEKSYVELIEEYGGANVQNFAAEGYTTQDVLDCLEDAQVQTALSEADVIVVTVGIHDIMDPFMAKANEYMEKWQFEKFEDVFFANLADYGLSDTDLNSYFMELSTAVKSNRATAKANVLEIGAQLSAYSNAQVIFQTAYNPIDTIVNLEELSTKRKAAYNSVCNVVNTSLNANDPENDDALSLNAGIWEAANTYKFDVVDTFTYFKGYAYQYANLSDLDLNPTAKGHAWMAAEVLAAAGILRKGDANADGSISAQDAAAVLVNVAALGSGKVGSFDAARTAVADVDGSAELTSVDAAKILVYAVVEGTGGNPSWD